jgi:hypothetical protein
MVQPNSRSRSIIRPRPKCVRIYHVFRCENRPTPISNVFTTICVSFFVNIWSTSWALGIIVADYSRVSFCPVATSCILVAAREELKGTITRTMGGVHDTARANVEDTWIRQALAHIYPRCGNLFYIMIRLLATWPNQFQTPPMGLTAEWPYCLQLRIRILPLERLLAPHILAEPSTGDDCVLYAAASQCVFDDLALLDLLTR